MSTTNPNFIIDPDAILPRWIDWSDWLIDDDTISASTWTLVGCSKVSDTFDNTRTKVILSPSVAAGGTMTAKNHVTSAAGYEDDRTLTFDVQER